MNKNKDQDDAGPRNLFYSGNDECENTMMCRGDAADESKMSNNSTSGKCGGLLRSNQSDTHLLGNLNGTTTTRQNTDTVATDIQAMTNSIG